MRTVLLTLLTAGLLSGCFTTKLYYAEAAGDKRAGGGTTHKDYQHTLFWGFVTLGETNLSGHCKGAEANGIKKIKTQVNGWGLLAAGLTGGIWTPYTVTIVCAREKAGS